MVYLAITRPFNALKVKYNIKPDIDFRDSACDTQLLIKLQILRWSIHNLYCQVHVVIECHLMYIFSKMTFHIRGLVSICYFHSLGISLWATLSDTFNLRVKILAFCPGCLKLHKNLQFLFPTQGGKHPLFCMEVKPPYSSSSPPPPLSAHNKLSAH